MTQAVASSSQGVKPGFSTILSRDFIASIVVFLVAMPLCMGIAVASGVPAERGLITGIIGGVIVAPRASEIIYPIAMAVERRMTVDQVARVFAVYPSLTTSISDAVSAMHVLDRAPDPEA